MKFMPWNRNYVAPTPEPELAPPSKEVEPGSFRISPHGLQFEVEEYQWSHGRFQWERAGAFEIYPNDASPQGSEKECEKYIRWRLEERVKREQRQVAMQAHALANPPREVPPFKYGE